MDLKKLLKTIKLHESQISMVLGTVVLLIAAIFAVRYIKTLGTAQQVHQETSSAQTQNNSNTHKVVKGETLWSIAQNVYKDGNSWKKIADANKISDPTKLEVGQELVIPEVPQTKQPVEAQAPAQKPVPQITPVAASTVNEINGASYKVVKGDCLWTIAVRAYGDGFQWVKISKANKLKNPNIIHPGNVLQIPR